MGLSFVFSSGLGYMTPQTIADLMDTETKTLTREDSALDLHFGEETDVMGRHPTQWSSFPQLSSTAFSSIFIPRADGKRYRVGDVDDVRHLAAEPLASAASLDRNQERLTQMKTLKNITERVAFIEEDELPPGESPDAHLQQFFNHMNLCWTFAAICFKLRRFYKFGGKDEGVWDEWLLMQEKGVGRQNPLWKCRDCAAKPWRLRKHQNWERICDHRAEMHWQQYFNKETSMYTGPDVGLSAQLLRFTITEDDVKQLVCRHNEQRELVIIAPLHTAEERLAITKVAESPSKVGHVQISVRRKLAHTAGQEPGWKNVHSASVSLRNLTDIDTLRYRWPLSAAALSWLFTADSKDDLVEVQAEWELSHRNVPLKKTTFSFQLAREGSNPLDSWSNQLLSALGKITSQEMMPGIEKVRSKKKMEASDVRNSLWSAVSTLLSHYRENSDDLGLDELNPIPYLQKALRHFVLYKEVRRRTELLKQTAPWLDSPHSLLHEAEGADDFFQLTWAHLTLPRIASTIGKDSLPINSYDSLSILDVDGLANIMQHILSNERNTGFGGLSLLDLEAITGGNDLAILQATWVELGTRWTTLEKQIIQYADEEPFAAVVEPTKEVQANEKQALHTQHTPCKSTPQVGLVAIMTTASEEVESPLVRFKTALKKLKEFMADSRTSIANSILVHLLHCICRNRAPTINFSVNDSDRIQGRLRSLQSEQGEIFVLQSNLAALHKKVQDIAEKHEFNKWKEDIDKCQQSLREKQDELMRAYADLQAKQSTHEFELITAIVESDLGLLWEQEPLAGIHPLYTIVSNGKEELLEHLQSWCYNRGRVDYFMFIAKLRTAVWSGWDPSTTPLRRAMDQPQCNVRLVIMARKIAQWIVDWLRMEKKETDKEEKRPGDTLMTTARPQPELPFSPFGLLLSLPFDQFGVKAEVLRLIPLLKEMGEDINFVGRDRVVPFIAALKQGHWDVLKTLIDHGADVNKADSVGLAPICRAGIIGQRYIVQQFLELDKHQGDQRDESSNGMVDEKVEAKVGKTDDDDEHHDLPRAKLPCSQRMVNLNQLNDTLKTISDRIRENNNHDIADLTRPSPNGKPQPVSYLPIGDNHQVVAGTSISRVVPQPVISQYLLTANAPMSALHLAPSGAIPKAIDCSQRVEQNTLMTS